MERKKKLSAKRNEDLSVSHQSGEHSHTCAMGVFDWLCGGLSWYTFAKKKLGCPTFEGFFGDRIYADFHSTEDHGYALKFVLI